MNRLQFITTLSIALAGTPFLSAAPDFANRPRGGVRLGIDELERENFKRLKGLRIGLLTHPAGVNCRGESTIQILHTRGRRAGVKLVKLFGPEHGIYGDVPAEKIIQNQIDAKTGLPVFSLYGATRKPTAEMLRGLDRIVIDLQDIGSRSYTYISCMRYVIEACLEAGIGVTILDRPNPLGGLKVGGPGLEKKWESYVGLYPTPYVHGLTIGELAKAALGEGWFSLSAAAQKRIGKVDVVKMYAWERSMRWRQTGLKWIPTSPYINSVEACEGYAMTGLGTQLGDFGHTGRLDGKIAYPFRFLTYPQKSDREMATLVNSFFIRGLAGSAKTVGDKGGAFLAISNWDRLPICHLNFYLMRKACEFAPKNPFAAATKNQRELWIKHVGVEALFNDFAKNGARVNINAYFDRWAREAEIFQARIKKYWLY
ncbi:MAG: DUF1343 domain-containing protein [Opitutales bacterium]|nr:DUF1343 domain-containing protein [Opitutales bacterium]